MHASLDKIAAVVDWEYAIFIPDPHDMRVGDSLPEQWQ